MRVGSLIPAFKKRLVSAGGVSAHFGRKFGFNKVSTDVTHAVSDELCNMVAIVSRHNSMLNMFSNFEKRKTCFL